MQSFPMGRSEKLNACRAFLWVALKNSMQSFPTGRSEKLNAELSYGSL
ncbi:hypothetical protein IQA62_11470 [Leptospira borgpetersenii serovar Ballum]|nr:hypothetical protein [Leptospira borgpetersenii]MBE8337938.1 hypothetical protein [Leptospira borgpetersenii serovar Ballum]